MNTIELPVGNNVVPLRSDTIRLVQNGCSFHGLQSEDPNQHLKDFLKLVDSLDLDGENREKTRLRLFQFSLRDQASNWLKQDLALYDNESWNDQRDFTKLVKAIALPQDGPSTSDRRLIELENQVQRLMEAHLALTQPTQVNKVTTSCEICSCLHDTQYCMEDPEQAFVEYASLCIDKAGGEMTNKIDTVLKAITDQIAGTLPSNTVKNPKLSTSLVLSASSYPTQDPQCSNHVHGSINTITIHPKQPKGSQVNRPDKGQEGDGEVMFIEIIRDDDEPKNKGPNEGEGATTERPIVEYFDTFLTRDELTYHKIKGMHVFVGNFTYTVDFMIIEDISSIIDLRLSQVVLGKPFVEISNMTHDPQEGVVRFTNGNNEVSYKMPHKIEQYSSLSNLEKEHTKSVYLRNEEDKRRGVEYVMSKILGFYKECLELGPEYLTGIEDEGEVT
ncbi:hypothetical protein Tco_0138188 [Tanacetum coccineum]